MPIDIQEFTNADISVSPTGVSTGNFGILGFVTNEEGVISVAERARSYTSLASVLDDWATTTEVYKAAAAFYGQTPTPRDFKALMCFETAQAATVLGGGSDTLVELVAITTGAFDITVDGTPEVLTSLDFSTATTFDEVATIVDTALTGATCIHNGVQFVITSVTTGLTSTVTFATSIDGTSASLGLEQHQGLISDGIAAETIVDALGVCLTQGIDWIGTVLHKKYRDIPANTDGTSPDEVSDFLTAAKKIFMNTTNDLSTLSSVITTDVGSRMKAKTSRFVHTGFSRNASEYPAASIFGRMSSVNFEGISTTLTLNLKQMPGITVEDLTPNQFAVMRSKNVSAVVKVGKSVNAFTDSRVASNSWLDTTHGLMWLENRIETDMFNLLYQSNTKVKYSQEGINTTEGTLERSLQAAVRNGLSAPGFLPDGTFLPNGYDIQSVDLADVPAGDKGDRAYRGLSFRMVGAGALHEVYISGSFTE